MKRSLFTIFLILLLPCMAGATDYYVTQLSAGGTTGADCANAQSLAWFNANAVAGDTAILCDGDFTSTYINPTNSGTSGNVITYEADSGATVTVKSQARGLYLQGTDGSEKEYITISGITFGEPASAGRWADLDYADNIIIDSCIFSVTNASAHIHNGISVAYCDNLTLTNNKIGVNTDIITGDYQWDNVNILYSTYVIFEGNEVYNATHTGVHFNTQSNHIIVRNNYFQQEWDQALEIMGTQFLVEGNRFYNTSMDVANSPFVNGLAYPYELNKAGPAIYLLGAQYGIIRQNKTWHNHAVMTPQPSGRDTEYNKIYHNSFFDTLRTPGRSDNMADSMWVYGEGVATYYVENNNIINNIFYKNPEGDSKYGRQLYLSSAYGTYPQLNEVHHNIVYDSVLDTLYWMPNYLQTLSTLEAADTEWHDNIHSNPIFSSETMPTSADTQPTGMQLAVDSPAIDAATYLTLTNGTGTAATAFTVDDAGYFYDGYGIAGETPDTIYVAAATPFSVAITDVTGNVLTLASAQTWEDGVAVYHCPNGVCFSGTVPDVGAYEYGGPEQNTAPHGTYTPGGNIMVYGATPTVALASTITDTENDTINYLWTVPGSDKDGSTDADPGDATFTCAEYPCSRSCSLKVTDEHGAYTTYSFTVTHNETADTFTDILLWWRCEALDFSGTNGTLDYSAEDDIAAASGSAAINTDAVKYGTNGLDCPAAGSYVTFAVSLDDILDADEGRIGFWYYRTTQAGNSQIVRFILDANNRSEIYIYDTDGLRWEWKDGGTERTALTILDADLDATTWYFIEAAWKVSTDYSELFVNGVSKGSSAATIGTFAPTSLLFGNISAVANNWFLDNIMVSNDSTRDFNALKDSPQYPGYAKIGSIGTAEQDGTYGIDDSLSVPVFFVDGNGDAKAVTWTDVALPYGYLLTNSTGIALRLYHASPATGVAASTHWFSTHATDGDYVNSMIAATMASADLTISSIVLEGGTFDADMTIPTGENLADNAAIVIDTTATSLSIATIARCDSDGVPLGVDTTNSTAGTIYASITLAGSELGFFSNGPIRDFGIPLSLTNGTCVLRYASTQPSGWGVGHNEWLFEGVLEAGDRDDGSECILDGAAMTRPLGTKIIDGGGNELSDYYWPSTDILSGFTWRVLIPSNFTIGSGKDLETLAGFIQVPLDRLILCDDTLSAESYTVTVNDVFMSGKGLRTMDALVINANNFRSRCIDFSSVTNNGSNNKVIEGCVFPTHTTILQHLEGTL